MNITQTDEAAFMNTMKPRCLIVAPSAYPLGGVQTWIDYLIPGLSAYGWEVALGLVSGRHHDCNKYLSVHPITNTVIIKNSTGSAEGRVKALTKCINKFNPDVILSVNIPDIFPTIERLRFTGVKTPKVVMTNHSVEAQYICDSSEWAHVIDAMVGTNKLTCALAREMAGIGSDRIFYAPYGVEVPDLLYKTEVRHSCLRIAYSGRLDIPQKLANDIPKILTELDNLGVHYKLVIAGTGPYESDLKSQLNSKITSGQVVFLGFVAHEKLSELLYSQSDCLLMTSYWETGPLVIWEAMAYGLPIVSTRYIGSGLEGSLIHNTNCLIYDIDDVRSAAFQLQRMLDPLLRSCLSSAGLSLVKKRYTRPISVDIWNKCLRDIIDLPQLPVPHTLTTRPASGRLDKFLGSSLAESIRSFLNLSYHHRDAGGEWPHTISKIPLNSSFDASSYWKTARLIDSQC